MKTTEERLVWATSVCTRVQMRLTAVRRAILSFLAVRRVPATLEMVSLADGVHGRCDSTTVYRTLMMFKEAELVRLVGTPHKVSYFVLNMPGENNHFLICRRCGNVVELPALNALNALEKQIADERGYSAVHHELEVYGICPPCRVKSPADATTVAYGQQGMTIKIGVKAANQKRIW